MGLLKHLLFWPVTGPSFLTRFSLDRVHGVVRDELTDDTRIKAELMELQLQLELGDIDEAEYDAREADLMLQLREVREWRESFGMGVSGGLVRMQGSGPAPTPADERPAAAADGAAGADADEGPQVADPRGGAIIDLHLDPD